LTSLPVDNSENRLAFGKVRGKSRLAPFLSGRGVQTAIYEHHSSRSISRIPALELFMRTCKKRQQFSSLLLAHKIGYGSYLNYTRKDGSETVHSYWIVLAK